MVYRTQASLWYGTGVANETPLQPVFYAQMGVCPLLLLLLHPTFRSRPRIGTPFPAQSIVCHHVASFLATSTASVPRFFGTTNYGAPTDRHTDRHRARTPLWPTTSDAAVVDLWNSRGRPSQIWSGRHRECIFNLKFNFKIFLQKVLCFRKKITFAPLFAIHIEREFYIRFFEV